MCLPSSEFSSCSSRASRSYMWLWRLVHWLRVMGLKGCSFPCIAYRVMRSLSAGSDADDGRPVLRTLRSGDPEDQLASSSRLLGIKPSLHPLTPITPTHHLAHNVMLQVEDICSDVHLTVWFYTVSSTFCHSYSNRQDMKSFQFQFFEFRKRWSNLT